MREINSRKVVLKGWKHPRFMRWHFGAAVGALGAIPLALNIYGYPIAETSLAILLIEICFYPALRRFTHNESGLPTMAILCGAYAIQFALPIFTQEATIELAYGEVKALQSADVVAALIAAIIGICALQFGFYWIQNSSIRKAIPVVQLPLNKSKAVLFCIVLGIFLPLLFTFKSIIPEDLQQPLSSIFRLLQNQALVVIGILAWIVYGRRDSKLYTFWLYGLLVLLVVRGVASGSLEEAIIPIAVFFIVKWLFAGKLSPAPVVLTFAMIIFLSPVKGEYRKKVGLSGVQELSMEASASRATIWIEQAYVYWTDTLSGSRGLSEATSSATSRTDLVHQVAHIHSMTPSVIPYQYGTTYSYFAVALIPRLLWPDKPVAGNANNFYAVTYGITDEEGIEGSTFGVSLLGEAFLNFGWFGVVGIMLIQGLALGALQTAFGEWRSAPGGQAVFLAFFVFFLNGIGSSAEIVFGNILQNVICGYLLLVWASNRPRKAAISKIRIGRQNDADVTTSTI